MPHFYAKTTVRCSIRLPQKFRVLHKKPQNTHVALNCITFPWNGTVELIVYKWLGAPKMLTEVTGLRTSFSQRRCCRFQRHPLLWHPHILLRTDVSCALTFSGSQTRAPTCAQSQTLGRSMSNWNCKKTDWF